MPLYDYECKECSCTFEELIMNHKEIKNLCCPKCGSNKIQKLVSLFGVAGTEKKINQSSCNTCSTKSCSTCG